MPNLTCPIPSNINPLQSNGFLFSITKLPDIKYFCQEASIPDISLPPAIQASPLYDSPIPGDKLDFTDLTITFLMDEDMTNYMAINDWMMGLGFPKSHAQYTAFIDRQINSYTELSAGYSDGTLQILNSANNAVRTVRFIDMYPRALGSITLTSTTDSTTYLAGQATFAYTYHTIE